MDRLTLEITAPTSKSSSLRALICAVLSYQEQTLIHNISRCSDVKSGISAFRELGFSLNGEENLLVSGSNIPFNGELSCGESGFLLRVLTSLFSHFQESITLTGEGTLLERNLDIEQFTDSIGLLVSGKKLPLTVMGSLSKQNYIVDGKTTSQFISGLLFSLPLLPFDTTLKVVNSVSKPYIELSIKYLRKSGVNITTNDYSCFSIKGNQEYSLKEVRPETDWSSVAFLLVLGALNGDIVITDIVDESYLPDRVIYDILQEIGVEIEYEDDRIKVRKSSYKGFNVDINDCPDLAPALVSLAIGATSPSVLHNCSRLLDKESNRLTALMQMMDSLNVKYIYKEDSLTIYPTQIEGAEITTFGDHRIAMAALILNSISLGKITIDNSSCIDKSYPTFIKDTGLNYE